MLTGWALMAVSAALTIASYIYGFEFARDALTGDAKSDWGLIMANLITACLYWGGGALLAMTGGLLIAKPVFQKSIDSNATAFNASSMRLASLSYLIGVPQGQILGPLLLHGSNGSSFQSAQHKSTYAKIINFQLSITTYGFAAALFGVVLIGFVLLLLLLIFHFTVSARSLKKPLDRYPFRLEFLQEEIKSEAEG